MDEVVREIKETVDREESLRPGDAHELGTDESCRWLRMLLEEREQLQRELKHSQNNMLMAISTIKQKDNELEKCHIYGFKLSAKAAEQDKEIQKLKETLHNLRIGIGNGYEFGYIRETDQGDVQNMLDRIEKALK